MSIWNAVRQLASPASWRDLARLVRNHRWEQDDTGDILIAHARVAGVVEYGQPGQCHVVHNSWTTEGLGWVLQCAVAGSSPSAAVYIAPFGNNVIPSPSWKAGGTGAGFKTVAGELSTQYQETNRLEFLEGAVTPDGVTATMSNAASKAEMTAAAATPIYGIGVLTAATKLAESAFPAQALLSAARFTAPEVLSAAGATLGIGYTFKLTPE